MKKTQVVKVEVDRVYQVEGAPKKIVLGQILKLNPRGNELLRQVDNLTESPIDEQNIADTLNVIVAKLKKVRTYLSDTKLEYTSEWRKATKEANGKYNKAMEPISERIDSAIAAVQVWDDEQGRIQHEAEERARLEAEENERKAKAEEERRRKISEAQHGDGSSIQPVVRQPEKKIIPYSARRSTQLRTHWEAEITSFATIPDEFKTLNVVKVNQAMHASKDKKGVPQAKIPGIKWVNNPTRVG